MSNRRNLIRIDDPPKGSDAWPVSIRIEGRVVELGSWPTRAQAGAAAIAAGALWEAIGAHCLLLDTWERE